MTAEQLTLTPKAQETRQRIFDTAVKLFMEKGYEETTMRDIAAEAGCSLGLAYRYFESKEVVVVDGRIAAYDATPTGQETVIKPLPPRLS